MYVNKWGLKCPQLLWLIHHIYRVAGTHNTILSAPSCSALLSIIASASSGASPSAKIRSAGPSKAKSPPVPKFINQSCQMCPETDTNIYKYTSVLQFHYIWEIYGNIELGWLTRGFDADQNVSGLQFVNQRGGSIMEVDQLSIAQPFQVKTVWQPLQYWNQTNFCQVAMREASAAGRYLMILIIPIFRKAVLCCLPIWSCCHSWTSCCCQATMSCIRPLKPSTDIPFSWSHTFQKAFIRSLLESSSSETPFFGCPWEGDFSRQFNGSAMGTESNQCI